MDIIHITTAINLKSVLATQNAYFIVEKAIVLGSGHYTLGSGSVLDFEGGSFTGSNDTSLNLNEGTVIAGPYPVFSGFEVTGFSNSKICAEWFMNNPGETAHLYINRALRYAKGCPVVLQPKDYALRGTISFPETSPSILILPGSLSIDITDTSNTEWNNAPVAIDINVSNVRIDIDKIFYPIPQKGSPNADITAIGTGIRVSGQVFHVSINVNTIRGIDISPGRANTYANVQFLNIKFQSIVAEYCVYIDICSTNNPESVWITRSSIHGGRMRGDHGIYMADAPDGIGDSHISEVRFTNIGFENLTNTAIRLRSATRLRFEYIRMAENLSELEPWIDFKNVTWTSFNINGGLRADKYTASGKCDRIILHAAVWRNSKWGGTPFDTIAISSAYNPDATGNRSNQKIVTCSISPSPMTKLIAQNENLQQIQPGIIPVISNETADFKGLKALPRMLLIKQNTAPVIDIEGIAQYAPCILYVFLENNATLTLTSENPRFYPSECNDDNIQIYNRSKNLLLKKTGLYQMVWFTNSGNQRLTVMPMRS